MRRMHSGCLVMGSEYVDLEQAVAFRKKKQWLKAASLYRAVVSRNSGHYDAWYYLAVCCYEAGRFEEGLEAILSVVPARPDDANAAYTYGLLLTALGRGREAEEAYLRALALKPDFLQAHVNLAYVYEHAGDYRRAIEHLRHALRLLPNDPLILTNLGSAQSKGGRFHEALESFAAAMKIAPDFPGAVLGAAMTLASLQRVDEAIALYRRAVDNGEDRPDMLNRFAQLLLNQNDLDEALRISRRSVAAGKKTPQSLVLLGKVLERQGKLREAKERYQEARRADPDALGELARFMISQGQGDEALSLYREAASKHPSDPEAYLRLGATAVDAGCYDEAIRSYRKAIELAPDNALAHTFLAYRLLAQGNFRDGWDELEWRLKTPVGRLPETGLPRFTMEAEPGSRVLIQGGQGYGDVLQFSRYAIELQRRGYRPLFWLQPELMRLFASVEGVDLHPLSPSAPPLDVSRIDAAIPGMSLPRAFGHVAPELFPLAEGYLTAEPWPDVAADQGFKIGMVWAGSPSHPQDWFRSMPAAFLDGLDGVRGLRLYSLQKPSHPRDLEALRVKMPVVDLAPRIHDFADAAAAIASMDLVLTVDTATAHLAGALGKPVWLLLAHVPEWRWMFEGGRSPWYASMRLWRQKTPGAWGALMQEVRQELERIV